jgi:hypothetical protein
MRTDRRRASALRHSAQKPGLRQGLVPQTSHARSARGRTASAIGALAERAGGVGDDALYGVLASTCDETTGLGVVLQQVHCFVQIEVSRGPQISARPGALAECFDKVAIMHTTGLRRATGFAQRPTASPYS